MFRRGLPRTLQIILAVTTMQQYVSAGDGDLLREQNAKKGRNFAFRAKFLAKTQKNGQKLLSR